METSKRHTCVNCRKGIGDAALRSEIPVCTIDTDVKGLLCRSIVKLLSTYCKIA